MRSDQFRRRRRPACLPGGRRAGHEDRVHPSSLAGVLSAYGMGLADQTAMRERAVEGAWTRGARSWPRLDALGAAARAELLAQGVDAGRIELLRRVHLRYEGTDSALLVPFADHAAMQADFEAAYRRRFSFLMPGKGAGARSGVGGSAGPLRRAGRAAPGDGRAQRRRPPARRCRCSRRRLARHRDLPARRPRAGRPGGRPGHRRRANATTSSRRAGRREVTPYDHLVLRRVEALPERRAIGTTADPVMLEIFNNLFMSIAEQMGLRLQNTAYSVNIKERLDFSCAIFDADGNLVANAPHMPVHLGSMGESIKTVMRENAGAMRPGDVFAQRPLQRRHPPARRHRDLAGVRRRRRRSCSMSARAATTPTSAAPRPARCRRIPPASRKRAS
jgi:5-oxoprolinase (ATP-hydrolysing)